MKATSAVTVALNVVFASAVTLFGAPRTSSNYRVPAEAVDSGGRGTGSASYQNHGSAGLISGTARSSSGALAVAGGYIPQIAPTGNPLQVVSAVSRKMHGTPAFDVPLPLTGLPGVECRTGGAAGNFQVLVTFATPVTVGGLSVMSRDGMASGTTTVSGTLVTVNLTAVANAQTLGITLVNVNNGNGSANVAISMAVLVADTSANGVVNSGDALQTRSRSGQAADAVNFRSDVNVDGVVNSGDALLVRARSGTALP